MIFKQAQIDTYLKKPNNTIKAILLYGQNEGLISEYSKKFITTISADPLDPFSVVYLNWDDIKNDIGLLSSEYNSQSLMGTRRVVVIRDADNNLSKPLEEILISSFSDTLLIVCASPNLNSRSSLVNLANTSSLFASIACYEDRDENITTSIRSYLIENNITCSNDAFMLLCSRLSNDRKSNLNELEKLITYVGSKKHFEIKDIKAVIFDQAISGIDDLCFYTFSGNKLKSINSLKHLLNEGIEEIQIIRALIRHSNKLLEGKALIEGGDTPSNAIKRILAKNLFYRYDMGANQLNAWPKDRLFDVMDLLYKSEKDCKTTNTPSTEIVSYTILTLLSAASKLKI